MKTPLELFQSALMGSQQDCKDLTELFFSNQVKKSEIDEIYNHWQSLPVKDDANYFYLSGLIHDLKESYSKAADFYEKAIPFDHADAIYNRGLLHSKGRGGPVNAKAANALCDKAIKLNHAKAMNRRAYMYQKAEGRPVDYRVIITLLEKAIELGEPNAMNNRACMYERGEGSLVNYQAAIALYEKAIKLNNVGAMINRAYLYHQGEGSKVDIKKAINLYLKGYKRSLETNNKKMIENIPMYLADISNIPLYYQLKIKAFINPNAINYKKQTSHYLMNQFNSFFNDKKALFKKIQILESMANDEVLPIPEEKQIEYCKILLSRNDFENLEKHTPDEKTLALIAKALSALAREAYHKKLYQKADNLYKRVPKKTPERVDACVYLSQRIYFEAKDKGQDLTEAYKLARPYLMDAMIKNDMSAKLFYEFIVTDVTKTEKLTYPKPADGNSPEEPKPQM